MTPVTHLLDCDRRSQVIFRNIHLRPTDRTGPCSSSVGTFIGVHRDLSRVFGADRFCSSKLRALVSVPESSPVWGPQGPPHTFRNRRNIAMLGLI